MTAPCRQCLCPALNGPASCAPFRRRARTAAAGRRVKAGAAAARRHSGDAGGAPEPSTKAPRGRRRQWRSAGRAGRDAEGAQVGGACSPGAHWRLLTWCQIKRPLVRLSTAPVYCQSFLKCSPFGFLHRPGTTGEELGFGREWVLFWRRNIFLPQRKQFYHKGCAA